MVRKGFVALFIAGEKVGEGDEFSHLCGPSAVGALGNEGNDGMVSLVHVAPPKHFVEPCERFGSACENHETTHGTIESVHGAEKDFAGFVVLLFDIGFDLVGQRSIAGFVALNDFAGGLVDNDHVIVFVEDFHRGEIRMKMYGVREGKADRADRFPTTEGVVACRRAK